MSDPCTEEWEEAATTAPTGRLIYPTIEFQHQVFTSPMRFVTGVVDNVTLGIEDTAIYDPGDMVVFTACPFSAEKPEFAVGQMPECTVTVDNVSRVLIQPLMDAVEVQANLTMVYREYVSDDLTAPAYGPVEFVISNVKIKGTSVSGLARIDNLSSRKFPTRVYTISEFPGLLPG